MLVRIVKVINYFAQFLHCFSNLTVLEFIYVDERFGLRNLRTVHEKFFDDSFQHGEKLYDMSYKLHRLFGSLQEWNSLSSVEQMLLTDTLFYSHMFYGASAIVPFPPGQGTGLTKMLCKDFPSHALAKKVIPTIGIRSL